MPLPPRHGRSMQPSDPNWGTAYPSVVHALWSTTGDIRVIMHHLPNLVRYLDSLEAGVHRTGLDKMVAKYGDWLPPPEAPTPSKALCSAAAFLRDIRLVAEMADAIGNTTVAARFRSLRFTLGKTFNQKWLRNGTTYASGLQTELALPLWLGIVPPEARDNVTEALLVYLAAHDWHVTTGIVGTRALFETLGMLGHVDVALKLLSVRTYPSYGYMVTNRYEPSTTLWENWAADHLADDQADASRNHVRRPPAEHDLRHLLFPTPHHLSNSMPRRLCLEPSPPSCGSTLQA